MFKKILSYVVVLTLVVSYFTYNVSASEDDSISLPVELFDFDADGLFYEYVWGFGMNLYGKSDYQVDTVTKGLVEETLGQDGRPVYTRDAVESAARTIQENLFAGHSDEHFKARAYDTFNTFISHTPATNIDYGHDDLFGKFFDNNNDSWSLYGSPTSTIVDNNIANKWKKDGTNAIVCEEASSIVYKEAIPRGQPIKLNYYVCYPGFEQKQFSIDFIDENNNSIKHVDLVNGLNSYYNTYVEIPEGNGNVYLKLNGQTNTLIADMSISAASVLPLGDYDETVRKYNAGNLTNIDQCTTCMDYAYLRLKNFFNTSYVGLNESNSTYTSMKLNKDVTRNSVSYSFDSSKKIKYDGNTFYNENDDQSCGFFPLDHINGRKFTHDGNDGCGNEHNYHFGMIVDGDFIYKKGSNQFFYFSGDDDVYVFINNKLVVDLGGAHQIANANINIEEIAAEQGLTNGQKCSFKLFYLERHTTESNCKIQTNLNIGNHVGYNFVSGTEGKELPEEVTSLTPIDNTEYYEGQRVHVTDRQFNKVEVEDGTWEFIGWDKNSIQVFTENTFVGTWVFTPKSVDDDNNDSTTGDEDDKDETPTIEGTDKDNKKEEVTDNKNTDNQDTNNKVKTGDSTVISVYLIMMMVACLGIIHVLKKD